MSWLAAVPVALLCVVWLFLPGLLVTYGIGLRSLAAWGLAPVVTIAIVATTAVVAAKAGAAWSVSLVVVVALVVAVVATAVALLLRRRAPFQRPDVRRVKVAAGVGLIPAVLVGAVTVVHGFLHPDALSQSYDAVFHYNAVALILDSRNASSLTMGSLGIPGEPGIFYPAAWHDLTSLVVLTGGHGIPVSVTMISAVIAIVVWPVSCLLLVRQVVGRSAAGMAITGVLSVAFTAFPWDLLSFGVLWPNLLGMSIAPAVLALIISITGLAKDDAIGRGRAWVLLPIALIGAGFAHPNVLFSLMVLALFPIAVAFARRAIRWRAQGRTVRGVVECVVALVIFLAVWEWAATTPAIATVRTFYWAPFDTPAAAVGEVLLNATTRYDALWLLSVVVLIGIVLSRRFAGLRWLVAGFVLSGFLYMLTAALNRPGTQWFTGYWYNDPHRLAAMLPITAIPLAVVAIMWLGQRVTAVLARRGWAVPNPDGVLIDTLDRRNGRAVAFLRTRTFAVSTVVIALVLGALTGGFYEHQHVVAVASRYIRPLSVKALRLVDPAEQAFFAHIKKEIPVDAVVADNPWDGSALLWALADRHVLFPHLGIVTTKTQRYLANELDDALTDPMVCRAANQLHVDYLLIGDAKFWPWDLRNEKYPGFADPGTSPAFHLVDSAGALKLYRLVACGKTS
jgi:hypothetical protein